MKIQMSFDEMLGGVIKGALEVLGPYIPFFIGALVLIAILKILPIFLKARSKKKRNNPAKRNDYSRHNDNPKRENYLRNNDFNKPNSQPMESSGFNSAAPVCPLCGGEMVVRTRKTDGKRFYGCKAFPKCRGVVNIG